MEGRTKIIILLPALLLFFTISSQGQEKPDFTHYNQMTYQHYLNGEWDQVITLAREALKQDIDFYYLRARMGIAFYEKGIYTAAAGHLNKALEYNSAEPLMLEYLFYAYYFSGRYADAIQLYHKHKQILKEIPSAYRPRFFDGLNLNGTHKWSNHSTAEGLEVGNLRYASVGLKHYIGGRLNFSHFAGVLDQALRDKYYFGNELIHYPYFFYQADYFARLTVLVANGWEVSPAFHFTGVDAVSMQYNDIYYGIGIRKRAGRISIGFNYGHSEIYDKSFSQYVPEIVYYPFGNNKLYFSASSVFTSGDLHQQVLFGSAVVRIFPITWIEGFFGSGKAQYLSLYEGALIYNNPDFLISRTGLSITQYLNEKTSIQGYYIAEKKEQVVSGDPYVHHVLSIAINFKF
jgi:tetratricopeptide (TPR) repeat protein